MLNKVIFKVTTILFTFLGSVALAAPLSSVENKIQQYIEKNTFKQIQFLKKIVNINSGTSNIAGVYKVGKIVEKELKNLGFKTHWAYEPVGMHKAGTLIAERKGKQGKRILLIAHLDTVFSKDSPFQKFELKKQIAKGPGVIDDKGGIAVIIYALKALQAQHGLDNTSITIVLTGDEEDSGKPSSLSRQPLIEAAKNKDVALDFEPTMTLDTLSVSRRGVTNWKIESHGNESHSATIFLPGVGDGAIFESARILNTMRLEFKDAKDLSFNPGVTAAGNKVQDDKVLGKMTAHGKENVVAKIAIVRGDFRYSDNDQQKKFSDHLTKIVSEHLLGTHSTISFENGIPAMIAKQENFALLGQYSQVSQDLGLGEVSVFKGQRGAGDISHVAEIVPANLVGLGPLGASTHSVGEVLELNTLSIQTSRVASLIYRLSR